MAQPNANREPTMEEILASIRRIIESNDTVGERKPALVDAMADEGEEALEDDIAPPAASTPAFAPLESARQYPTPGERIRPAGRPVSLADVAARVRASGSISGATPILSASLLRTEGNAAVRIEPEVDFAAAAEEVEDEFDEIAAEMRADNDAGRARDIDRAPEDDTTFDTDIRQAVSDAMAIDADAAATAETASQADEAPEADAPVIPEVASTEESGRHLVSSSTGAKIAAAFDDLSEAFKAEQRRSFDEMAEEMLRPMLQQWLDDNLPTVVERLVREEIERVARGGRR